LDKIEERKDDLLIKVVVGPDFGETIDRGAQCLKSGGVVAYPTESFYGLAVDTTNERAIQRLFSVKERKGNHPILILIPSVDVLEKYVVKVPEVALSLIETFWPGGLTLVFRANSRVSPLLTSGTGKIGLRLSSHPVATALTKSLGVPISGTSANISGKAACRSADEVSRMFDNRIDLILDAGMTLGKAGSTVLDVTVHPPRLLREGMIQQELLEKFLSA
jgi:L-threonylcarbamoyladenylate synthase